MICNIAVLLIVGAASPLHLFCNPKPPFAWWHNGRCTNVQRSMYERTTVDIRTYNGRCTSVRHMMRHRKKTVRRPHEHSFRTAKASLLPMPPPFPDNRMSLFASCRRDVAPNRSGRKKAKHERFAFYGSGRRVLARTLRLLGPA